MTEPSKKSPAKLIILAVVIIAAVGGYIGMTQWEKDQANRIEANIKAAGGSVASVKVSFFGKSAALSNLKYSWSIPNLVDMTLEAESMTMAGFNVDALNAKGVVPLADTITMSNVKSDIVQAAMPGVEMQAVKQSITFKSATVVGLRGDFAGMKAEFEKVMATKTVNPADLPLIVAAAKTLHADSISAVEYVSRVDMGLPTPMTSSIGSYEVKDFNLLACGPATWKDFKVSAMNMDIIKIGGMTMQRVVIPDVFTPLATLSLPDGKPVDDMDDKFGMLMLDALKKEPLVIKGFSMSDMFVQALGPEALTLKNLSLDLELSGDKLAVKKSFADLVIPPAYYKNADEAGALLAMAYGKPLNLSGRLDFTGSRNNDRLDCRLADGGLSEKEFGAVKLDGDFFASVPGADSLEKILKASPEWLLTKANLSLEDKKVAEYAFAAQYEMVKQFGGDQSPFKSVDDVRANAVQQLQTQAAMAPNADSKAIIEGLAKLVQQSGTLVISLNPATPQPISGLESIASNDSAVYNVSTSFTPAAPAAVPAAAPTAPAAPAAPAAK